MKGIPKINRKYLLLFFFLISSTLILSCNGVTPNTNPPTINSFTASSTVITQGGSVTLNWETTGATTVYLKQQCESGVLIDTVGISGYETFSPFETTTYTLTANNNTGTVTATVQVILSITNHTVTFDSQGGSTVSSQTVEEGGLVIKPTAPTKQGYTLRGWYKESGCKSAWEFASDTVTADVTLYAKWTPLYALRDTGPAGGLIFYVKAGGYSDGWMYLEAAPSDQSTSAEWGCFGIWISDADGTAVGTGEQNTIEIEAGCTIAGTAADICANLTIIHGWSGYDDWFLPSKDELNLMYKNLKVADIGDFADGNYWSSSEYFSNVAWSQYFTSGDQYVNFKFLVIRVRAVRAF